MARATSSSARCLALASAPVAAIRSHTASASAAVLIWRHVERCQLAISLAGDDQRQRHGPVEQVGTLRLAGALRRTGDVEHVVEQLEREPDLLPEGGEQLAIATALERAQLAGGTGTEPPS